MTIPDWWEALLLVAASYRTWRLLALDRITEAPRDWLLMALPPSVGDEADDFVACPWCLGWWVALGWWGAWAVWPTWALWVATPLALSAAVGFVARGDTDHE